jgi:hypothetical protein
MLWKAFLYFLLVGVANAEGIYPNGDNMLFSIYSLHQPDLKTAKKNGLTAVGPYYGVRDRPVSIDYAKQAELPILFTIGNKRLLRSSPTKRTRGADTTCLHD